MGLTRATRALDNWTKRQKYLKSEFEKYATYASVLGLGAPVIRTEGITQSQSSPVRFGGEGCERPLLFLCGSEKGIYEDLGIEEGPCGPSCGSLYGGGE